MAEVNPQPVEHYVTIFDSNFLPFGLALIESLEKLERPFRLWVVAVDDLAATQLAILQPDSVTVIPLADMENDRLRAVRSSRTRGEYCWTLTPFLADAVWDRDSSVERVTYLDSDLYLFADPQPFFDEFAASGRNVLITEHAYAPIYDRSSSSGRFCVQFLIFRRSEGALRVLRWWQERCLEWCYARYEEGKFGDQKYLDAWPQLFAGEVHVLTQKSRTLAPWNVNYFSKRSRADPIFYHFQGFRLLADCRVKLHHGYRIARRNLWLYEIYLESMRRTLLRMREAGLPLPSMPEHQKRMMLARFAKYLLMHTLGQVRYFDLAPMISNPHVRISLARHR